MVKFFSVIALLSASFLFYCGYNLDSWPFIYLQNVPDKLTARINHDFFESLSSRGIRSIRIGTSTEVQREKCVVEVDGEYSENQIIQNPKVGVIYLEVDQDSVDLYWRIPRDYSFNEALSEITSLLNQITAINDETRRIKRSFE